MPTLKWGAFLLLAPAPVVLALWAGATAWQIALLAMMHSAITALVVLRLVIRRQDPRPPAHRVIAPQPRDAIEALIDAKTTQQPDTPGMIDAADKTAAIVLRLDDFDRLRTLHGIPHVEALMKDLTCRLGRALRARDGYCLLPPDGFGVAIRAQGRLDAASVTSIAERLQAEMGNGFGHHGQRSWHSLSVGLCLNGAAARRHGLSMIDAASKAAERARQHAPGSILGFSALDLPALVTGDNQKTLIDALEQGEIRAYFQPQIAADTGQVTGLEALARWERPGDGLIAPAAFLPMIQQAGLAHRLGQRMLADALDMLTTLDRAGLSVPSVAVNLSQEELHNPRLADEIAWALDSRDMTPDRLVVEILENVVADSDEDIAVRTIARLAGMGCGIDLDDFGTGHASIGSIRRFAVGRLKIDRSFVRNLHIDPAQRKMVSAILSMAEALDLATLAEGVECPEEMALLARMGCGHLQGYAIARPMPPSAVPGWLHDQAIRIAPQDTPSDNSVQPGNQSAAPHSASHLSS
ncbi:MAG: GGDEF domain-containing protein [Pararhodobacter sp.]|nr:GGDEF domain-containing protein [Pararhodobacter sp.]